MPQETGMAHRQLHPGMEVELDHPNIPRTAVWRVWRPVPEAIIESNKLHSHFDFEHTDVWTVLPMFFYQTSLIFFNLFPCNNGLFFSISFFFHQFLHVAFTLEDGQNNHIYSQSTHGRRRWHYDVVAKWEGWFWRSDRIVPEDRSNTSKAKVWPKAGRSSTWDWRRTWLDA